MKKHLLLISSAALLCNSTQASTEAKFSLVANTPTSVIVPANRHALVQYQVTNNTALTRKLVMTAVPNVTQRTSDSSDCANPFTLAPGASCNLTLYIDGSTLTRSYFGGPVVCKTMSNSNQPDPYLCSQPEESMTLSIKPSSAVTPSVNKLYVTNWNGNSVSLCYLETGNLSYCLVSGVGNSFANPEALAASGNYLFVANIGGGMSSCLIDAVTGELSNCANAVPDPLAPIHAPDGISIIGSTAYISNSGPEAFNQGVTECQVSGSTLTNCVFTQGDASFAVPSDLATFNNTVYVTNFMSQDVQTVYCTIGSPLCTTATGEGTISGTTTLLANPEGIYFATVNAVEYAYFTNNGNNSVVVCEVQSPTNFANCAVTGGHFTGFGNLAVLSSPLKAFIPSGLKSLSSCDVSTVDGSLTNCVSANNTAFNNPSGLLIQ